MQANNVVVALAADLIFAARMRAANAHDVVVILAKDVNDFLTKVREHSPRLAILDLDRRGLDVRAVVSEVAGLTDLLCYVSHVREDLIVEARTAGAQRVMARGAFAKHMSELLTG